MKRLRATSAAAAAPRTGKPVDRPEAKTAEDSEVEDILRKRGLL